MFLDWSVFQLETACLFSWPLVNDLVKENSDRIDRVWAGFKMFYKTAASRTRVWTLERRCRGCPKYFSQQGIDMFICQVHSHLLQTVETSSAENWEVRHGMHSGMGR